MAKERIVYDKSFKENAVKLSYERKEFESFGVGSFPGNSVAKMIPEEKEVAALKERIRQIELENEILKKAMHIFSRDI